MAVERKRKSVTIIRTENLTPGGSTWFSMGLDLCGSNTVPYLGLTQEIEADAFSCNLNSSADFFCFSLTKPDTTRYDFIFVEISSRTQG